MNENEFKFHPANLESHENKKNFPKARVECFSIFLDWFSNF